MSTTHPSPNPHSLHQKCVCEICACGKHKCPMPHAKGDIRTSYDHNHPPPHHDKTQTQRKHLKYQSTRLNPSELVGQYKRQYIEKDAKRSSSVFERNGSSIMQNGSFEGQSSYNNSYKEYAGNYGDLRASILKRQGIVLEGKFDGESHYSQNYTGKLAPLTKMMEKKTNINLGMGKFDGQSTYNNNFHGVTSEVPEMVLKKDNIEVGSGRFEDYTSYNQNYSGLRGMPAEKAKSRDSLKPSGDFSGQSTYHNNYAGVTGSPSSKVIMKGQIGFSKDKIDSETTYATNYDYKGAGRMIADRPKDRKDLLKNDNKNYNQATLYTLQYQPTSSIPPQKIIHPSQIVIGSDKTFQGQSSYNQTYKDGRNQPRLITKAPSPNGVLPNGSFEGNSTYKNNYNQLSGPPSQIIKHKDTPLTDGGFSGNSTYVEHFGKGIPEKCYCPIDGLNPPKVNPLDQQHVRYNAKLAAWI